MEFTLELFANDHYKVLKFLSESQIKLNDEFIIPLSQQQIATLVHMNKRKSTRILLELIELGFVTNFDGSRGKYGITEKGHKALFLLQKNNA